ncbi:MAG TPA: helix-turn-helix transcriptional regulator [Patescibacteria group bacterium]|nr:helix-turn-helix transcriptional regulator [Patescibacteria group bacterium]
MNKKKDYSVSSGNIFADLGFPDAEERMAKTNLAIQINTLIKRKKLTQKQAAELLDIDQPKISALSTGKLAGFSLERLFRFLTILGQDITINITPKSRSKKIAHVIVSTPNVIKKPLVQHNNDDIRVMRAKKK